MTDKRAFFKEILTIGMGIFLVIWGGAGGGCSSAKVDPLPVLPEATEAYVKVAHPQGLDTQDLEVIFRDKTAPSLGSLQHCDEMFVKLKALTESRDEFERGIEEIVKADPVLQHWCFYSKLLNLENDLKKTDYVEERQKQVIKTYVYLAPIAQVFFKTYSDSRYLRLAISRYRDYSQTVFYRKLELSSERMVDLGQTINPYGLWRHPEAVPEGGVLAKYGLVKPKENASPTGREPAASQASSPSSMSATDTPDEKRLEQEFEQINKELQVR